MATKEKAKKKKISKGITSGIAHIKASFNNTVITIKRRNKSILKISMHFSLSNLLLNSKIFFIYIKYALCFQV